MHSTGFIYEPLDKIKLFDKDGNQINLFNLTIPNIDYNEEYYKFKQDDNTVIVNGSTVIVVLPDGTEGVAKCVDDVFTVNKGYQISLIRAKIKQHKSYINCLHREMEDNIKAIHLQIEDEQSQMKARIRHLEYLVD